METILAKPFEHGYENEMFENISEKIRQTESLNISTTLLAGNLFIGDSELDAVLIKKEGITILEFKNAEGPVHFAENGPWIVGEGKIVGGSRDNPFSQVRSYRLSLRRFLERNRKELIDAYRINPGHVAGCVVFRGNIRFEERVLDPSVRQWFHVTDLARCADKLSSIASPETSLHLEWVGRFVRITGLGEITPPPAGPLGKPLRVGILKNSPIRESFKRMKLLGNVYADGAEEASVLVTRMINKNFIPRELSQKEDSRIRGSIIYRVTGHCSLLVIRNENLLFPIVMGDPENLDHWIEKHSGYTITLEGNRGVLVPTKSNLPLEKVVPEKPAFQLENKPIFETLGAEDGLHLEEYLPSKQYRDLFLRITVETPQEEIEDLLLGIANEDHRTYLGDLIHLLLSGDLKGAKARILLRKGQAVPLEKDEKSAAEAVQELENSEDVLFAKGMTEKELSSLLDPDRFEDWMLFLHPDQQKFVETEYDQPVVLKGVSGSGKTCILVHRARYLAKKYPKERVGILTLNPKLVGLLDDLVRQLCVGEEKERIKVYPFYEVFKKCLMHFGIQRFVEAYYESVLKCDPEPRLGGKEKGPKPSRWRSHNGLSQVGEAMREIEDLGETRRQVDRAVSRWPDGIIWNLDPTSKTSLSEQWDEFHMHGNPEVRSWMRGVETKLQSDTRDAMKYLREEFSLIQSSFPIPSRFEDYLKRERTGRCVPFEEKIRHDCLRLLAFWEEWLISGGFIDESIMALALHFFQKQMQTLPAEYRFRCLLIDEMQDFSTIDLRLIRALSQQGMPDALFLAGDPVQKILVKNHDLTAANLDRGGGALHYGIKKNYRNSRQILEAASMLVQANVERAEKLKEKIELLKPDLALRETNRPTAVKVGPADMAQAETAWALAKLTYRPSGKAKHAVCITTCCPERKDFSVHEILNKTPSGMEAYRLGTASPNTQSVAVCELEDLKGFEFRTVIVIGCDGDFFPSSRTPPGETWREALRLYVAMTRARDQLFFLHGANPSEFLIEMWESLDSVEAGRILREAETASPGKPETSRLLGQKETREDRPGFCRTDGCRSLALIGEDYCYSCSP